MHDFLVHVPHHHSYQAGSSSWSHKSTTPLPFLGCFHQDLHTSQNHTSPFIHINTRTSKLVGTRQVYTSSLFTLKTLAIVHNKNINHSLMRPRSIQSCYFPAGLRKIPLQPNALSNNQVQT